MGGYFDAKTPQPGVTMRFNTPDQQESTDDSSAIDDAVTAAILSEIFCGHDESWDYANQLGEALGVTPTKGQPTAVPGGNYMGQGGSAGGLIP